MPAPSHTAPAVKRGYAFQPIPLGTDDGLGVPPRSQRKVPAQTLALGLLPQGKCPQQLRTRHFAGRSQGVVQHTATLGGRSEEGMKRNDRDYESTTA